MSNDRKKNILIVEDNNEIAQIIEYMLQILDYNAIGISSSGEDAVNITEKHKPDLVLMDIHLKGQMDGIEAAEIIKSLYDIPVIFITGFADTATLERSKTTFPFGYILKPVNERELHTTIEMGFYRHELEKKLKLQNDNLELLVKQRTRELESSNRRLRITLSSMGEGLISVDREGDIILFNSMASELTGLNSEAAIGKKFTKIVRFYDDRNDKVISNPIEDVLKTGKYRDLPEHAAIRNIDGNYIFIEGSASPIVNASQVILGAVMLIRDVTEKREVERMKDDFISSISHELRTPLTSIKGYTATILRDENMSEYNRTKFLNIVNEEADRLKSLVDDLLEFARMESGRMRLLIEKIDIGEIANEVLKALEANASVKNINIEKSIAADLPLYCGDNKRIYSVFMNILGNAIKFTPLNGKIVLNIGYDNDNMLIDIEDDGIGIPKEKIEHIFDRFFRVERPGMEIPGTGLGLAITKKIVDLHDGKIEVNSDMDEGTSVNIALPRHTRFSQKNMESKMIMI